ncbi:GntR family transcriptional regulator [Streptacidiphilus sp. EB129]|uniref:GntR family transcriptional regulator n=1 Tax=Streptacidiphilus sp. EB129 TaxID=3156262 RepID=UPI003516E1A7
MSSDAQSPLRLKVQRSSLREQVAHALRDEMMAGRLPAGTHFTVKEIAELYGVSATPVREALVNLTAQDLLWMEHNRGFTVPLLSWADFLDIVEARTMVADSMFRSMEGRLERIDWDRLPSLRRRAEAAARAARAGQLDVLVGCDRRFWGELAGFVANRKLTDYLDWLRVQYWIFAAPHLRGRPDVAAYCWSGHLELVQGMADRDQRAVHGMILDYNRESLRQMARLCGEDASGTLFGSLDPPQVPVQREAGPAEREACPAEREPGPVQRGVPVPGEAPVRREQSETC